MLFMLKIGSPQFNPQLVVFDKDGTLIDFSAMWGGWIAEVGGRLDALTGLPISTPLFRVMSYDPLSGHVSDGPLAGTTMDSIRARTLAVAIDSGLTADSAEAAVERAWHLPDPVALARPLTDLPTLFGKIQAIGAKVAVATIDDRAPTEATLAGLGVAEMIDALVCADDGIPIKPAPDMILTLCDRLNIHPSQTAMVGDSTQDLRMGRAAGVGVNVGVCSGVTPAEALRPHADFVLDSIAAIT